jgi:hypothetical protein
MNIKINFINQDKNPSLDIATELILNKKVSIKTDIIDRQIKSACHWEKGSYKEQPEDNQKYIDELTKNENSEPSSPPQCT